MINVISPKEFTEDSTIDLEIYNNNGLQICINHSYNDLIFKTKDYFIFSKLPKYMDPDSYIFIGNTKDQIYETFDFKDLPLFMKNFLMKPDCIEFEIQINSIVDRLFKLKVFL